jgi:hypothetical protein
MRVAEAVALLVGSKMARATGAQEESAAPSAVRVGCRQVNESRLVRRSEGDRVVEREWLGWAGGLAGQVGTQ